MTAEAVQEHKIVLAESEMPTRWYNLVADLPEPPPPPLHPGTPQPVGPDDLAPLFPDGPDPARGHHRAVRGDPRRVQDIYRLWRPSPLYRAHRLEQALGTPARIYYKYEGVSPAGSHKPNTAVPQAYYNAKAGVRKLTTETGAGQWGAALAMACAMFGIECEVWQVGASYDQKPYRRMMIETFGATVHRSPSTLTERREGAILRQDPDHTGSLGIAISEAVEVAAQRPETRTRSDSVLNHVLLHQTIIGEEALLQLAKAGETPDVIVGCTGGGSNFAGLAFPFLREKLAGRDVPGRSAPSSRQSCPSLTQGMYAYDFGDAAGMTPLLKMHTLGHGFVPDPIHAGGLRYHGMSPLISHVYELGLMERRSLSSRRSASRPAIQFARTEGIVPRRSRPTRSPPPSARRSAARRPATRRSSSPHSVGHGHFDLAAYDAYLERHHARRASE